MVTTLEQNKNDELITALCVTTGHCDRKDPSCQLQTDHNSLQMDLEAQSITDPSQTVFI